MAIWLIGGMGAATEGRCPLYRKRPEPSDFDGWGGVDEIDVIFLFAWLAAPVELRGSRTRVGRYRRRRRCTPNADDNLVCVGMKIGLWRCQGFLRGLTPLTMEGTPVTWKGGRETDTAKRGLAMEWELSGAPVTAFRHRGDGDQIPPFRWQGGGCQGVLRGALQLRF